MNILKKKGALASVCAICFLMAACGKKELDANGGGGVSQEKPEEESGEEIMDASVDASVTDSTEDVESAEEAGSEEAAVNPYTKPDFRYP